MPFRCETFKITLSLDRNANKGGNISGLGKVCFYQCICSVTSLTSPVRSCLSSSQMKLVYGKLLLIVTDRPLFWSTWHALCILPFAKIPLSHRAPRSPRRPGPGRSVSITLNWSAVFPTARSLSAQTNTHTRSVMTF